MPLRKGEAIVHHTTDPFRSTVVPDPQVLDCAILAAMGWSGG